MTSPADLEAAADRLDLVADEVRTGLDRVAAFHRPDVWQGARAGRFGRELEDQRTQLRAVADELAGAARVLRARASLLRTVEPLAP
jgi:hypothetical protein